MQTDLPQEFQEVLEKWKKGEIKGQKDIPLDNSFIRTYYQFKALSACPYCGTNEDCDCEIKSCQEYSWYLQTQITKLEMSLLKTWFVFGIIIALILIFK